MSGRAFLDTNVLVYADDLDAGEKRARARGLLRRGIQDHSAVVSTQVLQEFYVVATAKLGVDAEQAQRKVELLGKLDVIQVNLPLIVSAIELQRLHSFSFWDALVVRAARAGGCRRILTEDLQHGRVIDGIRIENPFLTD